jgi:hypothetical protein
MSNIGLTTTTELAIMGLLRIEISASDVVDLVVLKIRRQVPSQRVDAVRNYGLHGSTPW